MKKIKSIRQLKLEKKELKQHRVNLEKKIHSNWRELKEAAKPSSIAREAWDNMVETKIESHLDNKNVVKSVITYGITLLAKKMATRAEEKLNKFFK